MSKFYGIGKYGQKGDDGMNFRDNAAHIVYASDDNFAEIMGISLVSLYENSKDMDEINIYILNNGITESKKNKLNSLPSIYHRAEFMWIEAKNISRELNIHVSADRGSLTQYARLFISTELPDNLERVLYLDCDTLFRKSVKELWNLDCHGKTVAALMDAFSRKYRINIDLKPDDVMFNSGVMLIDLCRWKTLQIEEKLLNFIAIKKGKVQQGDQGALNAVLSQEVHCFEPRFNSLTIFYDFTYKDMLIYRKPPSYYSEEEVGKALDDPDIVHFTTSFLSKRPWMIGCKHKYVGEWLKYKKMSPWKNEKLRKDNRAVWKLWASKLYVFLPHKIALFIASIIQAYGRPMKNRI